MVHAPHAYLDGEAQVREADRDEEFEEVQKEEQRDVLWQVNDMHGRRKVTSFPWKNLQLTCKKTNVRNIEKQISGGKATGKKEESKGVVKKT